MAALSENADPVAKVTILPRGRALGVTEQLPEDERRIYPESYLLDSLTIRLGGRAAERLLLGQTSSGASNDLAGATQLATRMVREFGMSPASGRSVSPRTVRSTSVHSSSRPGSTRRRQRVIDEEVSRLLKDADDRAGALLESRRDALEQVVALLLERETVDGEDVERILQVRAPGVAVVMDAEPSQG